MTIDTKTVPTRNELLIDLAIFAATVVVAVIQDWKATDIVWASWIASLLIGLSFYVILALKKLRDYALAVPRAAQEGESDDTPKPMEGNPGCLFVAVGGLMALLAWFAGPGGIRTVLFALVALAFVAMVVSILAPRGWLGVSLRRPVVRAFVFLPTSLFLVFFFLIHFGGFHLGHAFVLSFFVPPEVSLQFATEAAAAPTVEPATMSEAFANLREALADAREAGFAFLGLLILAYWPYVVSVAGRSYGLYREALLSNSKRGEEMLLPYKNVIRLHLLIFALIPLAAFGSGLILTIGVMVFYYFPVESVGAWLKSR